MRTLFLRLGSLLPRTFMAFSVDRLPHVRSDEYFISLAASSSLKRSVLANGLKPLHSGVGLNESTG